MNRRRVLVVDDDQDFADALVDMLDECGHSATVAYSGSAAMDMLDDQSFDLALLDLRMPGMTGVESFFRMRETRPGMSVMMMTAYGAEDLLQSIVKGGAMGVLYKPFDTVDVLATIEQVRPGGMVLVVDDDDDFASSVKTLLSAEGHAVQVARTGAEALERMASGEIDVLVLDLRLPVLDGLQVYLELQALGRLVPTIVVTGYAEEEADKVDALQKLDLTGFLTKPFRPDLLLGIVAEAAERSA